MDHGFWVAHISVFHGVEVFSCALLNQAFFLNTKLELDWAQEFQNVEFLNEFLEFLNKFLEFFHGNVLSFELFKENADFWSNLLLKMMRNGVPLVFTKVS